MIGRPFRFLLAILALWIGSRALIAVTPSLKIQGGSKDAGSLAAVQPGKKPFFPIPEKIVTGASALDKSEVPAQIAVRPGSRLPIWGVQGMPVQGTDTGDDIAAPALLLRMPESGPAGQRSPVLLPVTPTPPDSIITPFSRQRWALSAWALVRPSRTTGTLAGNGQLGGSQLGARLSYDLTQGARQQLSPYVRVTSALAQPAAAEAAFGIALQPDRNVPFTLAIERRTRISAGGRDAMALYAAAGLSAHNLPAQFRLDGYAQVGIVGARSTDMFIDGKMSLSRPLRADDGLRAGIAISGGAQPGVKRLDIGPELSIPLRIGTGNVRAIVEWRERIAGQARPGSGATFTLAADF